MFCPSDLEIEFEGKVVKSTDGPVYKEAGPILTLISSSIMFHFDDTKYESSSAEIDSVYHPGKAMTMFGLLTKNQG